MESIKIWIISLCGATAITSLFKILLSGSALNKVLNVFFSIFILFYTVMPIEASLNDFEIDLNDSIDYNEVYKSGYEQIVETSIASICKEVSVDILNLNIESNVNEDKYLIIEKIEIDIDDNERAIELENIIKEKLGYEVTVK